MYLQGAGLRRKWLDNALAIMGRWLLQLGC